ncbi:MAG: tripartite tricarboxylate transporter substrate binding protein [Pseudorhodoferax sp.]
MHRRSFIARSTLALSASALGLPAARAALSKEGEPIKLVVPFAAGGSSDTVSRAIGVKMSESLGIPVIVDNRPGGGGVIGANAALTAKPDGRTLFVASNGAMIINPALRNDLRYNPDKDFKLVAAMAQAPIFIWAKADLPARSVADLVRLAKTKPLSVGSAGTGNITHLASANFASIAGIELTHAPFSGDTPALAALAGGSLDLSFNSLVAAQSLAHAGRIRPLAILADQRDPALPEVPTLVESGYPGTAAAAWFGLAAAAAVPDAVVAQLNKAVNLALAQDEVQQRLRSVGFTALPGSVADFQKMYDTEAATWRPLVKKLGLKVD